MSDSTDSEAQYQRALRQVADGHAGLVRYRTLLGSAKEHFMKLQCAWDNNDFSQTPKRVTPELYNLLHQERAEQPANNRTEVVRLFTAVFMAICLTRVRQGFNEIA